jgi:hypothetical protein
MRDINKTYYITNGLIIRFISTMVILILPIDYRIKTIAIFATDFLDCIFSKINAFYNQEQNYNKICKSFNYQIVDKVADLITYLIIYVYLGLNPFYLFLIILRLIGIILFYSTSNSKWLIICPDVFKEMLLYKWFIEKINYVNFTFIFSSKMLFEYIWHTYQNPNNYK